MHPLPSLRVNKSLMFNGVTTIHAPVRARGLSREYVLHITIVIVKGD